MMILMRDHNNDTRRCWCWIGFRILAASRQFYLNWPGQIYIFVCIRIRKKLYYPNPAMVLWVKGANWQKERKSLSTNNCSQTISSSSSATLHPAIADFILEKHRTGNYLFSCLPLSVRRLEWKERRPIVHTSTEMRLLKTKFAANSLPAHCYDKLRRKGCDLEMRTFRTVHYRKLHPKSDFCMNHSRCLKKFDSGVSGQKSVSCHTSFWFSLFAYEEGWGGRKSSLFQL